MSLYSMGIVAMPTITSKEFEIMISRDLLSDEIGLLIRRKSQVMKSPIRVLYSRINFMKTILQLRTCLLQKNLMLT